MNPSPSRPARDALLAAARTELAERGEAAVSMRAVARRAGLSHAAPAHFFDDRSGMLTAVAVDGFGELAQGLADVEGTGPARVAALGKVYFAFGWEHPALMDLMFRGSELHGEDPALNDARRDAIGPLLSAVAETGRAEPREWTLLSWALVHGLVVLSREGVMAGLVGPGVDHRAVATSLIDQYVARAFG